MFFKRMYKSILVIILLFLPVVTIAGELKFKYGFEDWTGDAATTPNYFSSTAYSTYWEHHILSTEVVHSGNPNCSSRMAQEGSYYFHQNFFTGAEDSCLGTTPAEINPHTNIGVNLQNPPNPKSNLDLETDILTGEMVIRFYFRTTDNWPNAVTNSMKFIRVYGDDTVSSMILISDDGSSFDITDHPYPNNSSPSWIDYHNIFTAPINWNDGEWHSVSLFIKILNGNNEAPNVLLKVWWDNWDMEGEPDGSASVYQPGYGDDFNHICLFVNWGNTFPDSSMGIDMDNIEIWDGMPEDTTTRADVDNNSTINTTDAMLTLRNSLGLSMSGTNWFSSATTGDVNCDGTSNSTDAMLILRHSLGLDMTGTGWCE